MRRMELERAYGAGSGIYGYGVLARMARYW